MAGTMPPTKRRNRKLRGGDPEVLAARLPRDLREFGSYIDPGDYRALWARVADWLKDEGHGQELAGPVMAAAGLSVAGFYRRALTGKRNIL